MATLTGAQGVATGHYHASILTNNEEMEKSCMSAGKISGDLVVGLSFLVVLAKACYISLRANVQ